MLIRWAFFQKNEFAKDVVGLKRIEYRVGNFPFCDDDVVAYKDKNRKVVIALANNEIIPHSRKSWMIKKISFYFETLM